MITWDLYAESEETLCSSERRRGEERQIMTVTHLKTLEYRYEARTGALATYVDDGLQLFDLLLCLRKNCVQIVSRCCAAQDAENMKKGKPWKLHVWRS